MAAGVAKQDLVDIARGVQAELLFPFCCQLADPGFSEPEVEDLEWGLFEVDENGDPIPTRIDGLHEDVFDMDPTGRSTCRRAAETNERCLKTVRAGAALRHPTQGAR